MNMLPFLCRFLWSFIKPDLTVPNVKHTPTTPSPLTPPQYPTQERRAPRHLDEFHLFTTVAEEHSQPPHHPYNNAASKDVDLAIQDEAMMAQICHYDMVHTATKKYMDAMTLSKKQYGLKAGLCRFTDCVSKAVMKELTQFHTLNCFYPWDPATLTCTNRQMLLLPSCS
jgi:hypothetical protein